MSFWRVFVSTLVLFCSAQNAGAVLRPQPGVIVTASADSLVEGGSTGQFTAALKIRPSGEVALKVADSAQCTFSATQLFFTQENWSTPQTVVVTAIDDRIIEGRHSCSPDGISASGADDYQFVTVDLPVFQITDNDKSELKITNLSDGDESGPQDNVLKVELSAPLTEPTLVELSYEGTATGGGVDYSGPTEVVIPAGETEVEVQLTVVEDEVSETTETVIVSASTSEPEAEVTVASAASRIADQQAPDLTVIQNAFEKQSTQFMAKRLDFIASHEPRSHRLLNRKNAKPLAVASDGASVTGVTISPTADLPASDRLWNIWMEGEVGHGSSNSDFYLGYVGADYLMSDQLSVGLMAQADATTAAGVDGKGWMIGPYVSAEITDHVFLDLRGLWGRSENKAKQDTFGSIYSGDFATDRWLLEAKLAGNYDLDSVRITPEIAAVYGQDQQADFTVSNGFNLVNVSGQTVDLGRLAASVNLTYLGKFNDLAVEPFIGAKINWNFESSASSSQDLRGALSAGLNIHSHNNQLSLSVTYDGLGTGNYESASAKLSFSHQF